MSLSPILLRRLLIAAVLLLLLWLVLLWRPSKQVRLHQKHLLEAVQERKWKTVEGLVSTDYKDRWGHTKPILMQRLPQVFGDFLACGVIAENESISWTDGVPVITSRIRIVGSGGPIARYAIQESTNLTQPFSFRWRHESWWPWDWKLTAVDQPEIRIPPDFEWSL
jgi:hypothetical protein